MRIFWNGERCGGKRVLVEIPRWEPTDPSKAWWRHRAGEEHPAVEVHYAPDAMFLLDDEEGRAIDKVTRGQGSPREAHYQLPWRSRRIAKLCHCARDRCNNRLEVGDTGNLCNNCKSFDHEEME